MPSSSKKPKAGGRHFAAVGVEREKAARDHGLGDVDREPPGEMVVAHARVAERRIGA